MLLMSIEYGGMRCPGVVCVDMDMLKWMRKIGVKGRVRRGIVMDLTPSCLHVILLGEGGHEASRGNVAACEL